MALLFAGTSLADFSLTGAAPEVITTTTRISPDVVEGIGLDESESAITPEFSAQTDLWFSTYWYLADTEDNAPVFQFLDSNGVVLFRIDVTGTDIIFPLLSKVWNGAAFDTLVTGDITFNLGALYRIDVHIVIDDTVGVFDIFVDGSLYSTFSGDTLRFASAGITRMSMHPGRTGVGSGDSYLSAMLIANEDTRLMTFVQRKPTGNGAMQEWDGGFADIDENGFSTTDSIRSEVLGDISTFTKAALPAQFGVGYDTVAVVLATRSQAASGYDAAAQTRLGGVNFQGVNLGVTAAAGPCQAILSVNPDTGLAWTTAEIDAAEFGVELVSA